MTWSGQFKVKDGKLVEGSFTLGGTDVPEGVISFNGWHNGEGHQSLAITAGNLTASVRVAPIPKAEEESDGS